jgi:hypothetical protein
MNVDRVELEKGFVVESRVHRGVSAVVRILIHRGATLTPTADGRLQIESADAATFHCAFYSRAILANGREPFRQSSCGAYLPLAFDDADQIAIHDYGCMLVEHQLQRGGIDTIVANDGAVSRVQIAADEQDLRRIVGGIALEAGVPVRSFSVLQWKRAAAIAGAA